MRSRRTELVPYAIALTLVALAVTVAVLRSSPRQAAPPAADASTASGPAAEAARRGGAVFGAQCADCHGLEELIGGAPRYAGASGREALIELLLAGTVGGEPGAHPDFADLEPADLAAVASHLLADWAGEGVLPADTVPVLPAEVAARRRRGLP